MAAKLERSHDAEVSAATAERQNRFGSEFSDTLCTEPSAHTTRAESRLSIVKPYSQRTHPSPPPSVCPATPVSDTTPPGTIRPNASVSRSASPHKVPPCMLSDPLLRVDIDTAHPREVNDQSPVQPLKPSFRSLTITASALPRCRCGRDVLI